MFSTLEAFNIFFFPCVIAILLLILFEDKLEEAEKRHNAKKRKIQAEKQRHNIVKQNNRATHGKTR